MNTRLALIVLAAIAPSVSRAQGRTQRRQPCAHRYEDQIVALIIFDRQAAPNDRQIEALLAFDETWKTNGRGPRVDPAGAVSPE